MGEVYRARDTRLERIVAIKILPAAFASDVDRLARFQQGARGLSALNHPNFLAIFDVGNQDSSYYLVCELLEGRGIGRTSRRWAAGIAQSGGVWRSDGEWAGRGA